MKIRAERDDLADVFGRANRAVGARAAAPPLTGVLCDVTGSTLRVIGTDLEITVRTKTEVEALEEGRSVIPAKFVSEAIRKMPVGAVTLESSDGELTITGQGPKFTVREFSVDEFPQLEAPDMANSIAVDGDQLAEAITQVTVAASSDATRPILTGVLVENDDDGVRLVATDSYRLAVRTLKGIAAPETGGLVPARGLRELSRTVGTNNVTMAVPAREAVFQSDLGTISMRLIEGTFPNYRQLLPDSYPNRMVVNREALLEALGRAELVAEDHIPVRLKMTDGGVEITVTRQDVGGEAEHLAGEYEGEADDVLIAFNPRYLRDGVSVISAEEIEIQVIDGLKPSVIRGVGQEDFLYLLMPVRIP